MKTKTKTLRAYLLTWFALLVLVALTASSAYIKLGDFNLIASTCISIVKTALVMAIFMELRRERGTTIVFALAGFFWLILLLAPTLSDIATR
jgi:cytochrome c oxidase subunit 4